VRQDIEQRARDLALYIIEHNATVRDAAKHFGVSKSTVHTVIVIWNGSFGLCGDCKGFGMVQRSKNVKISDMVECER
jgi:hypothetical protein